MASYVPGTPTSPISATASATSVNDLIPQLFNKQLAEESVLGSIYDKLSGMATVTGDKSVEMPYSSILMKVETSLGGSTPQKIQIGMEQPLQNCPRLGTEQALLGNEENVRMKQMTVYYNEIKHAMKYFGWGYYSNEQEFYGQLKRVTPKLINYFAELRDQRIQEAILMTYEEALVVAPHTSNAQMFNPNWFVPNTAVCNQPSYDSTALSKSVDGTCPTSDTWTGDFVEVLGDALYAATNDTANPEYCMLMVEGLLGLEQWLAQTVKMPKVKVGGKELWVYAMPSSHAKVFKNPFQTGSGGALFTQGLPTEVLNYPGVIGAFGNLLIVENERFPTLTLGGADGFWSLQAGFMYPGNNDGRNTDCFSNTSGSLNYVFDVGYVLGKDALIEWIANPLKMNLKETTEYEQIVGQAAYTCAGIQLVKYDNDTKSDTTYYCNGSAIVPVAAPAIITVK